MPAASSPFDSDVCSYKVYFFKSDRKFGNYRVRVIWYDLVSRIKSLDVKGERNVSSPVVQAG